MKFQLLPGAGQHIGYDEQRKVKTFVAGDVIQSEKDLVLLFPNKFQRIDGEFAQEPTVNQAGHANRTKGEHIPTPEEKDSVVLGKDITSKIKIARENDLKVFLTEDAKYYVVEADDVDVPIHPQPLLKKEVVPFIEKYLKG